MTTSSNNLRTSTEAQCSETLPRVSIPSQQFKKQHRPQNVRPLLQSKKWRQQYATCCELNLSQEITPEALSLDLYINRAHIEETITSQEMDPKEKDVEEEEDRTL
jgi:uncharacterized protein YjiS (DUF1127 family)